MKRLAALLLTLVMALSLVACDGNSRETPTPAPSTPVETAAATPSAAPVTPTPAATPTPETRIVRGDDGNEVEIPYTITRAAPVIGAFAQMTEMLTGGGGKIVAAAVNNISDYFKQVFPDYLVSNPNNYASGSVEDLIAAGAQVAYGPSQIFSDDQRNQLAAADIAYVPIDNITTVDGMCSAFLIIGEILGEEEYARAQQFVEYYRGNVELCQERVSGVPEAERVTFLSLFYSADAYTTINGRDICNEYIEAAGGVNLAKDYSPAAGSNSLTVDLEQIVAWNPQFIMTSNQSGKAAILADPALQTVDAVINGNVQVCPYGVYLWSVRSGEGSMLPLWLGTNMYPELFTDIDMEATVTDFFSTWYNYSIPADELERTLAGDASTAMMR